MNRDCSRQVNPSKLLINTTRCRRDFLILRCRCATQSFRMEQFQASNLKLTFVALSSTSFTNPTTRFATCSGFSCNTTFAWFLPGRLFNYDGITSKFIFILIGKRSLISSCFFFFTFFLALAVMVTIITALAQVLPSPSRGWPSSQIHGSLYQWHVETFL